MSKVVLLDIFMSKICQIIAKCGLNAHESLSFIDSQAIRYHIFFVDIALTMISDTTERE